MNKVAIYVRVSTLDQVEEGYSIGEQIDKLTKYCEIKDWTLFKVYQDGGFSGSNIDRPAMSKLIYDAKNKQFDTVIVYKLDRLSRSQKDTLYLIEEVFSPNSIGFLSLQESFDTSTAFGKAMIGILSVFAQLEREQIKERMQLGKMGRIKSGKSPSWAKSPFGYEYDKESGILKINPLQSEIVKSIFNSYLSGTSVTKLRDKLNLEGFIGKELKWSYRALRSVLSNPVYIGKQRYRGEIYNQSHTAIISEETFERVQKELEIRQQETYKRNNNYRPFQSKYILSGIARCGYCKSPLVVIISKRNKTKESIYKYQCTNRTARKSPGPTVYNDNKKCNSGFYYMLDLEKKIIDEIKSLQKKSENEIDQKFSIEDDKVDISAFKTQLEKINLKLQKLSELYLNNLITLDEVKSKNEFLQKEKNSLESKINDKDNSAEKKKRSRLIKQLFAKNIADMTYEEQKILINSLINKVDVTDKSFKIHWNF